jgi:glycosyltransferase involved in cell wall biosynthesis
MNKHRVAILFDNFGPYHVARLRAAAEVCELLAVEFGASSDEYAWNREQAAGLTSVTLNPTGPVSRMSDESFCKALGKALWDFQPEVVFVPGWGSRSALFSLQWCLQNRVPAVVMSESTAWDAPRSRFSEWVKGRLLTLFSSAFAGGHSHVRYLVELGYPLGRIFTGYDAVDNDFFSREGELCRQSPHARPSFLASARFVPKKNLPFLISAYAGYREKSVSSGLIPWNLILLGDGPGRPELEALAYEEGIAESLRMPGFVQYPDLPRWYAGASCFVHASRIEPWGLVVNEAMASGLPVIVSRTSGCAADLVREGVNGWTFDPRDAFSLAELMLNMTSSPDLVCSLGAAGRAIISEWGPERFAAGVLASAEAAIERGAVSPGMGDRILLSSLLRRWESSSKLP